MAESLQGVAPAGEAGYGDFLAGLSGQEKLDLPTVRLQHGDGGNPLLAFRERDLVPVTNGILGESFFHQLQ